MSVDPSVVSTILVADVQLWSLPGVQISRDCGLGLGSGGLRSWSWKHSRVLVVRKWSLPRPLRVTRRVGGRPEANVAGDGHDDGHWRRSQADVKWASWIQRSEPRRRPLTTLGSRREMSQLNPAVGTTTTAIDDARKSTWNEPVESSGRNHDDGQVADEADHGNDAENDRDHSTEHR